MVHENYNIQCDHITEINKHLKSSYKATLQSISSTNDNFTYYALTSDNRIYKVIVGGFNTESKEVSAKVVKKDWVDISDDTIHKLNHSALMETDDRIRTIKKEKKFYHILLTLGVIALLYSFIIMFTPFPMVYGLQVLLFPFFIGLLLTVLGGIGILKYTIEASKVSKEMCDNKTS